MPTKSSNTPPKLPATSGTTQRAITVFEKVRPLPRIAFPTTTPTATAGLPVEPMEAPNATRPEK